MPMPVVGRPKLKINWDKVDDQLRLGCTGQEIASYCGVCAATLYDRAKEFYGINFSEHAQQQREIGDIALRDAQYNIAVKDKNVTMLIWLGKQRLKQVDRDSVDISGSARIEVVSYNGQELKPWKDPNEIVASAKTATDADSGCSE